MKIIKPKHAGKHMQNNKTKESLIAFISLAIISIIVEFWAFYVFRPRYGLLMAVYIHISLLMSLLIWTLYRAYTHKNRRFSILLLVMVAATGPFGAGICLMTSLVYAFCISSATSPDVWITELLFQEEDKNEVYDRLTVGLDNVATKSGVEPFKDILNHGTIKQKQNIINKITRHFHPQFAPLLLLASKDKNAAVRVHAAASLAKIESHFTSQYMQLEKSLKDTPYYDSSWITLARIYEDYALAGLLDKHSLKTLQAKATSIYESYLAFNKDSEIQMHLARLYMEQGQPAKANKLLSDAIESDEVTPPAAILWYIESLFSLRKFAEVRLVAKNYGNKFSDKYSPEIQESLSMWKTAVNNNIKESPSILEKNYAA